jgi:hypothetical protein
MTSRPTVGQSVLAMALHILHLWILVIRQIEICVGKPEITAAQMFVVLFYCGILSSELNARMIILVINYRFL